MNEQKNDDFFKLDVELHLSTPTTDINYFPEMKRYAKLAGGFRRYLYGPEGGPAWPRPSKESKDLDPAAGAGGYQTPTPEDIIAVMDKYGVDMACVLPESMMVSTGYSRKWSTNGFVAQACEKYPDRFVFQPNVGPLIHRGVKNAVWELEYLVKERNAKVVKFYPAEDTYINDRQIWPFYEKCCELNIPVCIHTGGGILPFVYTKYCLPIHLEDVINDFPEIKIVAYHFGYPYHHDLNLIAAANPDNIWIGMSFFLAWSVSAPRRFAELIGEAMRFAGPDRIVWGSDSFMQLETRMKLSVEGWRDFQIPEDMQAGYGYAPITPDDRRKFFGENLARLINIEPKRRIKMKT